MAAALRARGGEERFHWTSHPWLITQLYANATGNVRPPAAQRRQWRWLGWRWYCVCVVGGRGWGGGGPGEGGGVRL
eukprot:SAG11_NODE_4299_length_1964_cov_1.131367_5_plen_75_part_01